MTVCGGSHNLPEQSAIVEGGIIQSDQRIAFTRGDRTIATTSVVKAIIRTEGVSEEDISAAVQHASEMTESLPAWYDVPPPAFSHPPH